MARFPVPPTPLAEDAWAHATQGYVNSKGAGARTAGSALGGTPGGSLGAPKPVKGTKATVGKVVKRGHARYQFALDLQFGIFHSVKLALHEADHPPTQADFRSVWTRMMTHNGAEAPPGPNGYDFTFRDYAGYVFRKIRETAQVDHTQYLLSLCGDYCLSELGSPGKSGQLFYFTRDMRFIIKTVSREEHVFLRKILSDFYAHLVANPATLLSQFYGLHMVKPKGKDKVYFVIMGNVFDSHVEVHERYDLKGSTVGRLVPDSRRLDPSVVMKDLDFDKLKRKIHLGADRKKVLMEQIRRDSDFLLKHEIMDYSLLLGIHYKSLSRGAAISFDQTLSVVSPSTLNLLEAAFPPQSRRENHRQEQEMRKARRRAKKAAKEAAKRELKHRAQDDFSDDTSSESVRGGTEKHVPLTVFRPTHPSEFKVHPLAASLNALVSEGGAQPPPRSLSKSGRKGQRSNAHLTPTPNINNNNNNIIINNNNNNGKYPSNSNGNGINPGHHGLPSADKKDKGGKRSRKRGDSSTSSSSGSRSSSASSSSSDPGRRTSRRGDANKAEASEALERRPSMASDAGGTSGLLGVNPDGTARDETYYVGIIDILQVYNARKKLEHFFKSFKYNSMAISAIAPKPYARRFCEYMDKCIV